MSARLAPDRDAPAVPENTDLVVSRFADPALRMTALVPVVIEHPLSSLTDEEIRGRATQALAQV